MSLPIHEEDDALFARLAPLQVRIQRRLPLGHLLGVVVPVVGNGDILFAVRLGLNLLEHNDAEANGAVGSKGTFVALPSPHDCTSSLL